MYKKTSLFFILKTIAKSDLILPCLLLTTYVIFLFIIRGVLPTPDELLNFFGDYYSKYGYQILFIAALLESLVVINLFAPGQVALALGIIFSRTGQTDLPLVMLAVILGAMTGYMFNYLIGLYGFADILKRFGQELYVEKAKQQLEKAELRSLFISFIHANVGSYMSLAAGALNYNVLRFFLIATFATIFWVIAWTFVIYSLGDLFLIIIKKYSLVMAMIFVGILIFSLTWKGIKRDKIQDSRFKI